MRKFSAIWYFREGQRFSRRCYQRPIVPFASLRAQWLFNLGYFIG